MMKMEHYTETKMTQAKNYLLAVMDGFRMWNTKSEEEVALCIAALLFLKKSDGLVIKSEREVDENKEIAIYFDSFYNKCLCYVRTVVEKEKNQEFHYILDHYIIKGNYGIDSRCVFEFVDYLNGNDFDNDELLCLLDYALANLRKPKKVFGSYSSELNDLFGSLLKNDSVKVFDPYGSMLDFVIMHPEKDFVVNEINGHAWEVGLFKLAIAGLLEKTKYLHLNKGWEDWIENNYDAIVTIPPFGVTTIRKQPFTPVEDAVDSAFKFFFNCTNEKGQMIVVVPMSFLSSDRDSKHSLRDIIVSRNWLDGVIVLPERVFYGTSIATALIVLNKDRQAETPICFVDGSECYEKNNNQLVLDTDKIMSYFNNPDGKHSIKVSKKVLYEENCSWLVGWYLFMKDQSFNQAFDIVRLNEILKPTHARVRFEETSGHLIDRNGLKADSCHFEFKPNDFAISTDLSNSRKITEPVIIVMSLSDAYPFYCEASEANPVFMKASITAYRVCVPNVHIGFLCLQLNTRIAALKKYVNLYNNRSTFNNILLGFPKLGNKDGYKEQAEIYEEAVKVLTQAEARVHRLESVIEISNEDYLKNIHSRKHALMQNTSSLALAWDNLLQYLESNNGAFDQNDVIGRRHPVSVRDLIDSISKNIRTIDNQAQHLTEVEYYWGDVEEFYIQDFISEYIKDHPSTLFRYRFDEPDTMQIGEYNKDGEVVLRDSEPNWKVKMPKNALRQVVDNIVSNAVSHGFTKSGKDYCISFEYYYDFDDIVLDVSNNGEPLREEINTEYIKTYGSSTKLNQQSEADGKVHSGIGGYDIYNILNKYNAEYEVHSTPGKSFTVLYSIKFHDIIKGEIPFEQDEY